MPLSPKEFFKRRSDLGKMSKYVPLLSYLKNNPDASLTGYVSRDRAGHYVHERTTTVAIGADEFDEQFYSLINDLEKEMQEHVVELNRKIYNSLEEEYYHLISDETILDSLDANDLYFDEEGEEVNLADYLRAHQLAPAIQKKVVQQYADLFNKKPDEVLQALVARDIRFDKRGNQVDISGYKKASELPDDIQVEVLDKHREWNVEYFEWWDSVYEMWTEDLEKLGFRDVEINFSGFSSQGDGASFTAKSIDVPKYILAVGRQKVTEAQALQLAEQVLDFGP